MKGLLQENNREKNLFKSYYCAGCRQRKPCQLLTGWDSEWKSYCCSCYYQSEQEIAREYSNYQKVYQRKLREREKHTQQLQLLKNYPSCKQCGSKEVDAYNLYEKNQLVCQPCLMRKEGGSSSPISFLEQGKWYKRWWKIEIVEWLERYNCLPVNAECARKRLKDRNHLNNCQCLEREAKKTHELFANSLKEIEEKLRKCACESSEKVRVKSYDISSYGYTYCERCEIRIKGAGKMGVIRNRNDPKFWGLEVKERVLCGNCLGRLVERMPASKKYTFNKYEKRGYWG